VKKQALTLLLSPLLFACQSTTDASFRASTEEHDAAKRATLMEAVAGLEGRWMMEGEEGAAYVEFTTSSSGTAVRELMFPGTEHEMTNMYTLDGNGLVMTHYCAHGNQPHMRATAFADGRLEFTSMGVHDLDSPDEKYMGSMTLVIHDENRIEEVWQQLPEGDEPGTVSFELTRVDAR